MSRYQYKINDFEESYKNGLTQRQKELMGKTFSSMQKVVDVLEVDETIIVKGFEKIAKYSPMMLGYKHVTKTSDTTWTESRRWCHDY